MWERALARGTVQAPTSAQEQTLRARAGTTLLLAAGSLEGHGGSEKLVTVWMRRWSIMASDGFGGSGKELQQEGTSGTQRNTTSWCLLVALYQSVTEGDAGHIRAQ